MTTPSDKTTTSRLPKTLTIGNITLDAPFYQSALSGYSDRAMRAISREYGVPLTLPGVMLDKVTLHPAALRKPAFAIGDDEHPIGAQILGSNPEMMASAALALNKMGYDFIDLNFACPAPKVLRRGRGGALLDNPRNALEIFQRVRDTVTCPVIIKLRIGFGKSELARDSFWHICEHTAAQGADALVVHGRTVQQRYRDKADWSILAELKQRFPHATIVGSGDIFTAEDIVDRLVTTGIDGILIARGAIGNPWIFPETRALLAGLPRPLAPDLAEQADVMLRHYQAVQQLYNPRKALAFFRKFTIHYCRRHPQRKKVQHDLIMATDENELRTAIKNWYGYHEQSII